MLVCHHLQRTYCTETRCSVFLPLPSGAIRGEVIRGDKDNPAAFEVCSTLITSRVNVIRLSSSGTAHIIGMGFFFSHPLKCALKSLQ